MTKRTMNNLDELIEKREVARTEERQLTQRIKEIRQQEADERKSKLPINGAYRKLESTNRKLLGMVAIYHRADGKTYKAIAELAGLGTPERARQLVNNQLRRLKRDWDDYCGSALEHGIFLADAAEQFLATANNVAQAESEGEVEIAIVGHSESWKSLQSAIYEFRKRIERWRVLTV